MNRNPALVNYAVLFLPYAFGVLLSASPTASYMVSWLGSVFILVLTLSGWVKPLPSDRSILNQVMRPIVLVQLMFVGYNFMTSIFYFLDVQGYYYFARDLTKAADPDQIALTAAAQRYYVLAHAGLATGLLIGMDYGRSGRWQVKPAVNPARFLLVLTAGALVIGETARLVPGLSQIGGNFSRIALVASVVSLAVALRTFRPLDISLAGVLYTYNLVDAFLSGWKEAVLVMVILLSVFAYPYYRKTVALGAPLVLAFLLFILPTYASVFRSMNWFGDATAEEAASAAIAAVRSGNIDMKETNWRFLTQRLSEVNLFTTYIDNYESVGAYGFDIVNQSFASLIPRILWAEKPITEELVMERAYEYAIVSRSAKVSAKPQYVVDGYVSGGAWGVLIASLVYGIVAVGISRKAEEWFGGYFFGSGVVFTGMFSILWRGNSFEFIANTLFWSFTLMYLLHRAGRMVGLIRLSAEAAAAEATPVRSRPGTGGGASLHPSAA